MEPITLVASALVVGGVASRATPSTEVRARFRTWLAGALWCHKTTGKSQAASTANLRYPGAVRGHWVWVPRWAATSGSGPPPDPDEVLDLELGKRLGAQGLWPLAPKEWDEDTFFALVEAIGDLVARPRARYMHFYSNCGWHYSQFALTPGQALYRSEVNDLFYRAGTGLQLAARRPM